MNWKVIETEENYNKAVIRLMEIFHAEPNTPEGDELGLLIVLIKDYEDKYYPIPKLKILDLMKFKVLEIWEKVFTWIKNNMKT
jgi:HTH-type transcriptional regulator/antitoxin HigA